MKRKLTKLEKLEKQINRLCDKKRILEAEFNEKKEEFSTYIKKHKSLKYDAIKTTDTKKLSQIYEYFDSKYPIEWQGGIRNDNRGMALGYWLYDKDDHIIMHLYSTCDNLFMSGSTSWLVYAPTLEEKVSIIKQIKKDMLKILTVR